MRRFLMICCVCMTLLCGVGVAQAGEMLLLLSQKYCSPLKGPPLYGCNLYLTNRIGAGMERSSAFNSCNTSCETQFSTNPPDITQCKLSCQMINGNDN